MIYALKIILSITLICEISWGQAEPKANPPTSEPTESEMDRASNELLNKKLDELLRKKELKEKIAKEKRQAAIKKQPKRIQKLINNGEISIGMTADQVVLSWGLPSDINRTMYKHGTHEQWIYNRKNYVYLDNGIVTAIQN